MSLQAWIVLGIVHLAGLWLIRRILRGRPAGCCGGACRGRKG
ncbi:hypothetical protein [Mesoterricola sediminis]|uniref:FeoB-associated Cys-rich membrane protein n=1 Tax=Mesoterricola sediminis TaxID=2927980 RepID=A0AA48KG58_9BACT|nr:hypothetical protein [Mesoterricola sediminis]BDU77108.1 hypothetical protein METESE_20660 [Mesoterricola sediminis]